MSKTSKVYLLLLEKDYEALSAALHNSCNMQIRDVFDHEARYSPENSDDTFVLLYNSDWCKWYDLDGRPYVSVIKNFIRDKRHTYIRFGDEREELEHEVVTEDSDGETEEFAYLVEPVLEVTNLNLFTE